jgi:uncharacterized GH25 family protein
MHPAGFRKYSCVALAVVAVLGFAPLVWGHYTWMVRTHYSSAGDRAYLEIGHGHEFPKSEAAINEEGLSVVLTDASGKAHNLSPKKDGNVLKIEAPLATKQQQRVHYVRDRGVMSQTADGWKPGGRDQHPQAKTSRKTLQYGITWIGFSGTTTGAKPLGLALELNYEAGMRGRMVRVMRDGKPVRNVEVRAVFSEEDERSLGKTDRQGYVSADSLPKGQSLLFTASIDEPAPRNSNFDSLVLSCTLSVLAD